MRDQHNNIHPVRCVSPVSEAGNTPLVGQIIDHQGFDSLEYVIATGSIADTNATFTVLLEEGDDPSLSDASAVEDQYLLGTELLAGFQFDDDNKTKKLGYVGVKRPTRLTITPAANTSAALISAVAILGHPSNAATENPPT